MDNTTFIERLIEEYEQLSSRLTNLNNFIYSEKVLELSTANRILLEKQKEIMLSYLNILMMRYELITGRDICKKAF